MKRIAIYGAGGFGKEVRGMVEMQSTTHVFAGFIDDFKKVEEPAQENNFDDVLLAIADPQSRSKIYSTWSHKQIPFASWNSPDVLLHPSVEINRGCIICPGVKMTVAISVGMFSILNLNCTIGHDVMIGEFCSIMPSVNISGNVTIGKRVFIGAGATILQGLNIGDDAIIGAGAVVLNNVQASHTVVGVPGRSIRK